MTPTTVFLDAGGVLVSPNWQRVSAALGARGVHVDPDRLAAADPLARRDIDLGLGSSASDRQRGWQYFNLVLDHCAIPASPAVDDALDELQRYHAEYNLWETVPGDVPAALDTLRRAGLKLVVVSNANGKLRALLGRIGLADRLDLAIDSAEEGVEKPDPRIFQIAFERSGAQPERTVHVGDLYNVDVTGARRVGLQAVLLDSANLYEGFDCPRIRKLGDLPRLIGAI